MRSWPACTTPSGSMPTYHSTWSLRRPRAAASSSSRAAAVGCCCRSLAPATLSLARAKLQREPELHSRARLVHADIRTFDVLDHAPFDVAILAVKSFAYLIERADQLACLQRIAEHLRPGGLLSIDFLHPRPEWLSTAAGSMRDDLVQQSSGVTVSRVESVVSTDLARQVRVIRSAYEIIDDR